MRELTGASHIDDLNALHNRQFTIVVAYSLNRVIGRDNQLPWHLSEDLQHFKHVTMGKILLMGRKTYDSIGRALPGRRSIVLSRNSTLQIDGCEVIANIAMLAEKTRPEEEIMVVGGEQIFTLLLPYTQKMLITEVQTETEGNSFFPQFDHTKWLETSREQHHADAKNDHDYTFIEMIRR